MIAGDGLRQERQMEMIIVVVVQLPDVFVDPTKTLTRASWSYVRISIKWASRQAAPVRGAHDGKWRLAVFIVRLLPSLKSFTASSNCPKVLQTPRRVTAEQPAWNKQRGIALQGRSNTPTMTPRSLRAKTRS